MAVMNITSGNQAVLTLGTTAAMAAPGGNKRNDYPFVQDVTVNAAPGIVRYSVLDSGSSKAFTTVNENSVSGNMLVDEDTFFGSSGATNTVALAGLFTTSTSKTKVFFTVAFEGSDSGDHYVKGEGVHWRISHQQHLWMQRCGYHQWHSCDIRFPCQRHRFCRVFCKQKLSCHAYG